MQVSGFLGEDDEGLTNRCKDTCFVMEFAMMCHPWISLAVWELDRPKGSSCGQNVCPKKSMILISSVFSTFRLQCKLSNLFWSRPENHTLTGHTLLEV